MTTRAVRSVVPLLLAVVSSAGFPQAVPDKPTKTLHVSGRVTDGKGRPLGYVVLSLVPLDLGDTARPVTEMARYDGLIAFSDVPPKKYRFSVPGGAFKILPAAIEVDAGDDIKVGDIAVQPDVRSDLKLEQIVVDPLRIEKGLRRRFSPGEMQMPSLAILDHEASNQPPALFSPACEVHSDRYQTVEAFLGGKVKAIRVAGFLGSSEPEVGEIQSRIMEVWSGVFRFASCFQGWSELTFWDLLATVEYEDDTRAAILMDGSTHVQVQDRQGRSWYIRLWPAVD